MQYQNQNDETLVMLTLAGEQNAYEILVVRYQRAVIASAAQVTHSQFMAEDAAQDAFVTAWMKLNTLKQPQKFGAWVCKIAKNCARNMVVRYRSFIDIDNLEYADDSKQNPAELHIVSEENDEIYQSIGKLPLKVGQIIRLHYFEGLSVTEIADKMQISQGTVKWQLHDGRKRIRKELCAMNERYGDMLVQRVMKKVEELKLWQVKNDKSGFEVIYNDVLREVEELPESDDKYHALSDVLMRGWWWLPGDKNDALFARIKEAAIKGRNDDVMEFIVIREDSQIYSGARMEFVRDKQIPMLEKAGFVRALAREWFWLGCLYFRGKQDEKGKEAFRKVREILKPSELLYTLVQYVPEMEERLSSDYKEKDRSQFGIAVAARELRYIDGGIRYWKEDMSGEGHIVSVDRKVSAIFRNSSLCDGLFFVKGLRVGETFTGTDGTTLTFASDSEIVETSCGIFNGCQRWVTRQMNDEYGMVACETYYKSGVGIIKHEHTVDGFTDVRILKEYHIAGGSGLLPLVEGNRWEYADEYKQDIMRSTLMFTVSYADEQSVIIASSNSIERLKYDENSWLDMIQQVRNEYYTHGDNHTICDVSHAVERAEALAKTPMEKAHTKAAASVVRRIMETDTTFNPDHTATGHWNFFSRKVVQKKNDALAISYNPRWSFEWKQMGNIWAAEEPLLYNDIYGILQDATKCIWSEEWRVGASPMVEYALFETEHIKTQIVCEDGGTVTTNAGTFENCLKLTLDISGMNGGISYRGGKKEYTFAPGIGIVRTVNEYCGGAKKGVYELTDYVGVGEGYMPMEDGMMRHYDALDLTDGFVAATEYTYVADDGGQIVIFEDRIGIRELPAPITQYASIQDEVIEAQLWEAGKWKEGHLRHAVNNFNIMLHYLARPGRHRNNTNRTIEICGFNLNLMELYGDGNGVPAAWVGVYAWTALVKAAALFGKGKKEEGYVFLKRAVEHYSKWNTFNDNDLLETGNNEVFGGVKFVKGEQVLLLPDGTREPVAYYYKMEADMDTLYYALTAPAGWEWFNSVRSEERFKECIEQVKNMK